MLSTGCTSKAWEGGPEILSFDQSGGGRDMGPALPKCQGSEQAVGYPARGRILSPEQAQHVGRRVPCRTGGLAAPATGAAIC